MVGLFKSETYEVFKDKKDGAELVKGEAQPNVLINCSVNLSSDLKERDELRTDISIDDAIERFDTGKLDKNLYIKNDNYLDYNEDKQAFEKAKNKEKTGFYTGGFSYIVDGNDVNCTFVVFDKNNGNPPVENKLLASVRLSNNSVEPVRSIKIEVDNHSKSYKPSKIQTISPKLYDYIVNNI